MTVSLRCLIAAPPIPKFRNSPWYQDMIDSRRETTVKLFPQPYPPIMN